MIKSRQDSYILGVFLLCFLVVTPAIRCSGDLNRHRLFVQTDRTLSSISNQIIAQATELVDNVVEDLLVLDSQNTILMGYLDSFDAFTAVSGNRTQEKLNSFYDVVGDYLDSDTTGDPLRSSTIETQLIALCLQRNGFDRWKRTVQQRTNQLQKFLNKKLHKHLDTLDNEDRVAIERRWKRTLARGGTRRLEKLREFIQWLGKFRD
ncbi:uncharacterized protein LOC111077009 [Drosophila obscura]|uniref:uncharacterized protein LOC111077009 n=1 Tax=Drosophila obscura TaxID=7282 RepID=UPI001BB1C822|nr:uncharacterized protein LOC111077009 [Drosophila obscura]